METSEAPFNRGSYKTPRGRASDRKPRPQSVPPQGEPLRQRWAMSPRRELKKILLERGKKSVQGITKSTSMHADIVALLFDILDGAVSAEDGPLPSR